jgi:hypothetical protein
VVIVLLLILIILLMFKRGFCGSLSLFVFLTGSQEQSLRTIKQREGLPVQLGSLSLVHTVPDFLASSCTSVANPTPKPIG